MIKSIRYLFRYYKEYGIKCTFAFYLCMLFPYSNKKKGDWRQRILEYKYKTITNYLCKHYSHTAEIKQESVACRNNYSNCIWTAWLQGEENAPEVIRITLASMRENANGHPVIVISNENVEQYIDIPHAIKTKHESATMGHAHYADVIRMMILAKYGGIWLDATMLLHEPIPEEAFRCSFYSVGFKAISENKFISKNKWLVRVIGGNKGSVYLAAISGMLTNYWEEHNVAVDYFVFDYLIYLLYQNDHSFHLIIDNLHRMEHYTNELRKIINEPFSEKSLKELSIEKQVYTLTYREKYTQKTPEGHMTLYGYLFNHFLGDHSKGE